MNCPHCDVPIAADAKICPACGRTRKSAPVLLRAFPSADATSEIAPQMMTDAAGPAAPVETHRVAPQLGVVDVRPHPTAPSKPAPAPAPRRPKPPLAPIPTAPSKIAPYLAAVGFALCFVSLAVVALRPEPEPTSKYLADVKEEQATFAVAPARGTTTTIDTTLALTIVREGPREAVATRIEELMRLEQKSVQSAEVSWVRDDAAGVVLDCSTECRVASQSGTGLGGDGKNAKAYPWDGHHATVRVVVPAGGAASTLEGGAVPVVGRDVAPCLTLRDVGAPTGVVDFGAKWRARIVFPLLATRTGAVCPVGFLCDVRYAGRRTVNGTPCYALSVRGAPPSIVPAGLDDMNRLEGQVHAALFFEEKTGLLVEAHATVDATTWLERTRVEDRVHVAGTMHSRRR
jgi:hypothetical protein